MKESVGIGVIGTGFTRRVQIPAFAMCEGARVVSVSSGREENARAAGEEFGIPHFTGDWRETVVHPDVDLVCITTPPRLHREMTLLALEHGKHILCEKPMAMNVTEAEEMTAAAKGTNVLALIDHELRFQDGRQKALAMIRDGAIGRIRHAKYLFQAPHRGNPEGPWNWWSDIDEGGGALGAINSHIIDSLHFFLGTEVSSVFCQLHTHIKERRDATGEMRPVTTDDQANMILKFADGEFVSDATGLVSVSMVEGPGYLNRLELFGTKGMIRIGHRGELSLAMLGETEFTEIETDLGRTAGSEADSGFSRGFVQFAPKIIDAIRRGETRIEHAATFEDGLRVQRVLDAARESDKSGRVAKL